MKSLVTKNILRFSRLNINKNLFKTNIRFFGSNAHAKSDHQDSHHDNHSSHESHGEHGDHGHHEITGEVDLEKVHVKNPKELHKFVSLIGLNNGDKKVIENHEHGHYKALLAQRSLAIPIIHQGRRQYRQLTDTLYEDNPYFHPEPYGYLFSDDPFDSNGHTFHALALLMISFIGILYANLLFRRANHPDSIAQSIFHAHYAAGLIEDEIIKIREQDYPYRLKYAKLKAEAEGKTFEEPNAEQEE